MEITFTQREIALLALCVGFAALNMFELEEHADENIKAEILALQNKLERRERE